MMMQKLNQGSNWINKILEVRTSKKHGNGVFAKGDILKGDRLAIKSYNCGSKNCRKKITENDWKLPELQKMYDGYFSEYLQEKIKNG